MPPPVLRRLQNSNGKARGSIEALGYNLDDNLVVRLKIHRIVQAQMYVTGPAAMNHEVGPAIPLRKNCPTGGVAKH